MTNPTRWLREHVGYQKDWCLIWPFACGQSGYGQFWSEGKVHRAHRYMCQARHGRPPTPKHQAAHSCGNTKCINPNHLSWKTASENQFDRHSHGTFYGRRERLTLKQAADIRAAKGAEPTTITANRHSVTEANIRQIQAGKTWKRSLASAMETKP